MVELSQLMLGTLVLNKDKLICSTAAGKKDVLGRN